jgi:hypothetical protein
MKPMVGHMKTLERSPTRLRLVHFSWYYGAIAAACGALCLYLGLSLWAEGDMRGALVFIGPVGAASLILGSVAMRKVKVTLDKAAGIVHVRNVSIFGTRVRSAPLSALKQAHMQTSNTGNLSLRRLVFLFHDREGWVVTRMYTSDEGAAQTLTQINNWIHLHLPVRQEAYEDHPQNS